MSERTAALPEVSVFIQTYQHVRYIRDAVEGVLAQRAPFEFELVIADDCSSDGTREILREYRGRYSDRVRLLLPERNLGPTQLFRRAVAELRGRYVAWLDGDDFWSDEEKLALQVTALRDHPNWAACFHDAIVTSEDAGGAERPYVPDIAGDSVTLADLLRRNCVPSLSVMARGDLVRGMPDWVWNVLWSDWSALIWLAQHGDLGYLPRPMGVYRDHRSGISSGLSRVEQIEEDIRFYSIVREVVGEERRSLIEKCIRERHCQATVERLHLPFRGAVAVLGPPDETPSYLNGRHVWALPSGPDLDGSDRNGRLASQLEHFRRAALDAPVPLPHFSEAERPSEGPEEGTLKLLVVGSMVSWLEQRSRLGRQLQGVAVEVWKDDACAVYEVASAVAAPAPMGALVEIADVTLAFEPEGLFGCHVDAPAVGRTADAHATTIAGWAIGDRLPIVSIELAIDGKPFRRVPLGVPRPDLNAAFPERSGVDSAGFETSVSLVGTAPEGTIELRAVMRNQRRVPFGTIRFRRRWREALDGESPLVSIVVPCYGQAHYLDEAIESVLAQTYAQLEVIVVDDGSPDNTSRVADRFPGVRCIRQENLGLAASRNIGIRESDGELLVFLDADDRLMPRALEIGVEELRRHPEAAFTFGRYRAMGTDGLALEGDDQPRPDDPPYSVFLRYNYAGVPATGMYRRSALEQVGGFDEAVPGAEDYDLGLSLSRQFAVQPHAKYVAEYRIHAGGMSRNAGSMLAMTQRVLRRQRKYVRRDAQLRGAYRAGRRFWRAYYGKPLAAQVRVDLANREWRRALAGMASLLRHHPGALLGLLRRPRAG